MQLTSRWQHDEVKLVKYIVNFLSHILSFTIKYLLSCFRRLRGSRSVIIIVIIIIIIIIIAIIAIIIQSDPSSNLDFQD